MEEILASIRRIIADDQAHSAPMPAEAAGAGIDLAASTITFDDDVLYADEAEETPPLAPRNEAPPRAEPRQAAVQPPAVEPPPPEAAPPATAPAAATEQPLLSTAADASAASAFQALSSVVLNRSPRTLDDLVQDMLRPLLKGWLDENLPPLVEKLVKAEIERISRNGR